MVTTIALVDLTESASKYPGKRLFGDETVVFATAASARYTCSYFTVSFYAEMNCLRNFK